MNDLFSHLKNGLIVSCQAPEGTPLHGTIFMAGMARAAQVGGAVGIRANSPDDIRAIKAAVALPIIGIYKIRRPDFEPYITPTIEAAKEIADAGADIIALDATLRPHPGNLTAAELIAQIKELGLPVMADISTLDEGISAAEAGADIVATTMSGYTPYSRQSDEPDFELITELAASVWVPIIAEGRLSTPDQAKMAIALGAHAVVIGTAITRPDLIARRFVQALCE